MPSRPVTGSALLAEFRRLGHRDERQPCQVAQALEAIPEKDRTDVLAALMHEDLRYRRGVRLWLAERGVKVSLTAITHHREGTCRCGA